MAKKLILVLLLSFVACSEKPKMIPTSLGKLKLEKYLSGKKAEDMINKMHISGNVAGDENEIGFYSSDTLNAVLYVSKFKNPEIAQQRLAEMLVKIAHSETPFSLHNQVNVSDKRIFVAFGMGQAHYIYTDKDELIWLSVDFPISLETLHSLLKQKR